MSQLKAHPSSPSAPPGGPDRPPMRAFITFGTPTDMHFIRNLYSPYYHMKSLPQSLQLEGLYIDVHQADNPEDLNWRSMDVTAKRRNTARIITAMISLVIMAIATLVVWMITTRISYGLQMAPLPPNVVEAVTIFTQGADYSACNFRLYRERDCTDEILGITVEPYYDSSMDSRTSIIQDASSVVTSPGDYGNFIASCSGSVASASSSYSGALFGFSFLFVEREDAKCIMFDGYQLESLEVSFCMECGSPAGSGGLPNLVCSRAWASADAFEGPIMLGSVLDAYHQGPSRDCGLVSGSYDVEWLEIRDPTIVDDSLVFFDSCYCNRLIDVVPNLLDDYCGFYVQVLIVLYLSQAGIAVLIALTNLLSRSLMRLCNAAERHISRSREVHSDYVKLFIHYLMAYCILYLLLSTKWITSWDADQHSYHQGAYNEYNAGWYLETGSQLTFNGILMILWPFVIPLTNFVLKLWTMLRSCYPSHSIQYDVDTVLRRRVFDIADNHAYTQSIFSFVFILGPAIPLAYPFGALSLGVFYYVEKIDFYRCRIGPALDHGYLETTAVMFTITLVARCCVSILVFGNPIVSPSWNIPALLRHYFDLIIESNSASSSVTYYYRVYYGVWSWKFWEKMGMMMINSGGVTHAALLMVIIILFVYKSIRTMIMVVSKWDAPRKHHSTRSRFSLDVFKLSYASHVQSDIGRVHQSLNIADIRRYHRARGHPDDYRRESARIFALVGPYYQAFKRYIQEQNEAPKGLTTTLHLPRKTWKLPWAKVRATEVSTNFSKFVQDIFEVESSHLDSIIDISAMKYSLRKCLERVLVMDEIEVVKLDKTVSE